MASWVAGVGLLEFGKLGLVIRAFQDEALTAATGCMAAQAGVAVCNSRQRLGAGASQCGGNPFCMQTGYSCGVSKPLPPSLSNYGRRLDPV